MAQDALHDLHLAAKSLTALLAGPRRCHRRSGPLRRQLRLFLADATQM
jgi:hypothetical protein